MMAFDAFISHGLGRVSAACVRRPRTTIALVLAAALAAAIHAAGHVSINMDTDALFPRDEPFRVAERHFDRVFPDLDDQIAVVIDAGSRASASDAAAALVAALNRHEDVFARVEDPSGGAFFRRNGLLYLSPDALGELADSVAQAQPLLAQLGADPSLRGLLDILARLYDGIAAGEISSASMAGFIDQVGEALAAGLSGTPRAIDWSTLISGSVEQDGAPRAFVLARPYLDSSALQPGATAWALIRAQALRLGLTPEHGYRVRLTGSVMLEDEEFASIKTGSWSAGFIAVTLVVVLLVLALNSVRMILASLATLFCGFLMTLGWASIAVSELNMISIAFAIMFVGLAIDFALQLCIRLRHERRAATDPDGAIERAVGIVGRPLMVAAAATAAGFFSFLPTSYRGVAQLGVIAGGGILIAMFLSITFLPALLTLLGQAPERAGPNGAWTAAVSRFLLGRRRYVMAVALAGSGFAAAGVLALEFDFDPLHLKDPAAESMITFNELAEDTWATPYTLNALASSTAEARRLAARLRDLPEVRQVVSLDDFVPDAQDRKLDLLQDLAWLVGPALDAAPAGAPPGADKTRASAARAAGALRAFLAGPSNDAVFRRSTDALASQLDALAAADPQRQARIAATIMEGFGAARARLAEALDAHPVTLEDLPAKLVRRWVSVEGDHRVEIYPRDDQRDTNRLEQFVHAVQLEVPDVTGAPVSVFESGRLILRAFTTAAVVALLAITSLLLLTFSRVGDTVRVLVPLLLAALLTLGVCGIAGIPINFANIIGLPILLGVGVTFPLYMVDAWRRGESDLLSSPAARAVLFSALTTLASFGALAVSPHRGTASLGLLLLIALSLTLLVSFVLLPAVLGPSPRGAAEVRPN